MSDYFVTREDCSRHEIFPGVTIHTAACRKMMLSYVEFEEGAVVASHQHPHEQVGLLLEGELEFTIGDETRRLHPGDMWTIPGNVAHQAVAVNGPVKALDIFNPIREDYL